VSQSLQQRQSSRHATAA